MFVGGAVLICAGWLLLLVQAVRDTPGRGYAGLAGAGLILVGLVVMTLGVGTLSAELAGSAG
jgi:dipeptide/tripeptide permease